MKKTTFIKIGAITSIIIFAFFWGVNFLKGKGLFDNTKTFYIVYNQIDGLTTSSPVLINGFNVGQVRYIDFLPKTSGKLIVQIAIDKKYNIPKGTSAKIFSSDIMGTKAIKLILTQNNNIQQPGDTLIADFEESMQDIIAQQIIPLKEKTEDLMKQVEDAVKIINYIFNKETQNDILADLNNIKKTLENLEKSSKDLNNVTNNSKKQIHNILNNVDKLTTSLNDNNQAITNTLNNISNITDSISNANIKQLVNETTGLLTQLNETTRKINNSEGSLGLLLNDDSLYYDIENITTNLNILLEDVHKNPKRYVHLSAFSKDKTIYIKEDTKEKITYSILLKQSIQPIATNDECFKNINNIIEVVKDNKYYYIVGDEKNIKKIEKLLDKIKIDFPNAKIVKANNYNYTFK